MSIGKEPNEIDAEQPDDNDVAGALGFGDLEDDQPDGELPSRETMWQVIQTQSKQIDRLEDRLDDLEDEQQSATETRQDLAKRTTEAVDTAENAEDIAKTAVSSAEQAKSIADTGETAFTREDPEGLPEGVKASSSPMDFYSNCRQARVKTHMVDTGQPKKNRFRALCLLKRWEEFATKRTTGAGVFFTRDDVREGLIAILGKDPHGMTINRVWDEMKALGASDLEETERSVSAKQESTKILSMEIDAADGLLESRYHHLDLIDADGNVTSVTPVVIDSESAEV